ncbi:hypothetical protein BDW59DRAFT_163099 [Aspergillus cavernicola]|uniref:Uncharacterized protein n=1 Tax=Aspergillus cavernicola TaxID=176166 RepID=A0ABR4I7K1_9EURO
MVLHMVCALGSLQICHNSSPASDTPRRKFEAATHYGVGLRLLDTAIQDLKRMSDLDFILATLWLMISYELAHGGGTGARLSVHLRSAALLLRGRLGNLRAMIDRAAPSRGISRSGDSQFHIDEDEQGGITCLTSQLLVWISLVDGSAASNGIDATFNDLIGEAMLDLAENEALSRLMGFSMLQRYATMVYLEVWDSDYPQSELIEDLQCSQIFCLQAEAGQLRYMLSKLANGIQSHQPTPIFDIDSLARAISDVEDLLTAASILELPKEGPQRRYVLNLRTIVPFYYGIVLLYYSLFTPSSGSDTRQRSALREIMTLAFRAHSDEGEKAMYQIAWPFPKSQSSNSAKKTITICTFPGFCVSILVTFISPYIRNPEYGNLGGQIGFLYGSFSFVAAVWTLFFYPETGFRSLEELDELFQSRVSVWNFRRHQTSGFGAQLAVVEQGHGDGGISEKIVA